METWLIIGLIAFALLWIGLKVAKKVVKLVIFIILGIIIVTAALNLADNIGGHNEEIFSMCDIVYDDSSDV